MKGFLTWKPKCKLSNVINYQQSNSWWTQQVSPLFSNSTCLSAVQLVLEPACRIRLQTRYHSSCSSRFGQLQSLDLEMMTLSLRSLKRLHSSHQRTYDPDFGVTKENKITKRYVFDASKIETLKSKICWQWRPWESETTFKRWNLIINLHMDTLCCCNWGWIRTREAIHSESASKNRPTTTTIIFRKSFFHCHSNTDFEKWLHLTSSYLRRKSHIE